MPGEQGMDFVGPKIPSAEELKKVTQENNSDQEIDETEELIGKEQEVQKNEKGVWKPFIKEVVLDKKFHCIGCNDDFYPGDKVYLSLTRSDLADHYDTMGVEANKHKPHVQKSCKDCLDNKLMREAQKEYDANMPEGYVEEII